MSAENREAMLKKVAEALKERKDIYGKPENSFRLISYYWGTYLGINLRADQVADMLELLKIARRQNQPFHLDNYIDSAGYAILAGEIAFEQVVGS